MTKISLQLAATLLAFAITGSAHASGTVQGHVYAADTALGLAGVTVDIGINCQIIFIVPVCDDQGSATTDANGFYSVADLQPGGAQINAYYNLTAPDYLPSETFATVNDGAVTQIDLMLQPAARIGGHVRRASDAAPVAGVTLRALQTSDGSEVADITSAADGSYEFRGLQAGSYWIAIWQAPPYQGQYFAGRALVPPSQGSQLADAITVNAGDVFSGADFSLIAGGTIEGVVTDRYTHAPIANASQLLVDVYDAADSSGESWAYADTQTTTDANGHYVLAGLPTVPIRLGVYSDNPNYNFSFIGCAATPCETDVTAAAIYTPSTTPLTVNFSLFPGAVVTGRVTRRSNGQPLSGITVQAYHFAGFLGDLVLASAQTDAQGRYTLTNISNFSGFKVAVPAASANGVAFVGQIYNDHDVPPGVHDDIGDIVDPPEETPATGIDFALDTGATISGQLVAADGGALLDGFVQLYADDGTFLTVLHAPGGAFSTVALPPGTYYLEGYATATNYDCVIYPNAPCDTADVASVGQPIVVSGTTNVTGLVIALPHDILFGNGFE